MFDRNRKRDNEKSGGEKGGWRKRKYPKFHAMAKTFIIPHEQAQ